MAYFSKIYRHQHTPTVSLVPHYNDFWDKNCSTKICYREVTDTVGDLISMNLPDSEELGIISEILGAVSMDGLLKSGAVGYKDKPIWYEVYKAFPPKYEPSLMAEAVKKPVISILYKEDTVRAKFFKVFGSREVINLKNQKTKTLCQKFVDSYNKLEKEEPRLEDELFEATVKSLQRDGINLKDT
ncbi:putative 28S ribosomal protein S23, mitochondrial [Nymphon striatum]|nr:putative 28S ribosomal protein S23, mitochondrial [Nymphon striatum]